MEALNNLIITIKATINKIADNNPNDYECQVIKQYVNYNINTINNTTDKYTLIVLKNYLEILNGYLYNQERFFYEDFYADVINNGKIAVHTIDDIINKYNE